MIIKDSFSKFTNISKLSGCIAFFVNEKLEITHLKKYLSNLDHKNLSKLLKNKNKKKGLLSFDLNPNQRIVLISLKKNQKPNETEKNGAKLTDFLSSEGASVIHIVSDTISVSLKTDAIYDFLHGMRLKSYSFDRYKSKKESNILKVNITSSKKFNKKIYDRFKGIELGVNYTKDLVSEPGNILHPDEYAKRLTQLKKIGLKVFFSHSVTSIYGRNLVKYVEVAPITSDGLDVSSMPFKIYVDLVAMSGGWSPSVNLFSQSGGKLTWDEELGCFKPHVHFQKEKSIGGSWEN